ncbi:MAG: PEP-CTERM sorting domain-containing protein, partial [Pirellulaceae bacterium]
NDWLRFRVESGGNIDLSSLTSTTGRVWFDIAEQGSLRLGNLALTSDARFEMRHISSQVDVAGSLFLSSSSQFLMAPGAQVKVGGDFLFQQTDETQLQFDRGILQLNGSGIQYLEAGGVDGGVGGSTSANFGIGRLEIGEPGAPTTVHVLDLFDNDNRGLAGEFEALYLYGLGGIDGLFLNEGSTLVLNDINVYAWMDGAMTLLNDLFGDEVVGVPMGAGFIVSYEPETGDFDLDGDVDFDDIDELVLALNSSAAYEDAFGLPAHLVGDVDGDGDHDFDDIDGFVALLTGGSAAAQAVPEPSAAVLLLIGLAACSFRFRTFRAIAAL